MKFLKWNETTYKELCVSEQLETEYHWLISCDCCTAPVSVSPEQYSEMTETAMPSDCVADTATLAWKNQKVQYRMRVIESLTADEANITDKKKRNGTVKNLAVRFGVSGRTINRWYYTWLVKGENGLAPGSRNKTPKKCVDTENYEWAINKYYYSSRKMSLRETYEAMLLARYTDSKGELLDEYPSYNSFLHYHRRYCSSPSVGGLIRMYGKSYYARNLRPLYGKATDKTDSVGVYEMDATIADIYLVSENDRTLVVGRPCIYLAVDVVSQLVAGVYVGFEQGESSVVECLRNAAMSKVEYCKMYGIHIEEDKWPAKGMPGEVITDRGREFFGGRMDDICKTFSVTETVLPAYRPELKGTVEKAFDLLQKKSKSLLYRKGVVSPDFQQRGAPDYRLEAKLTLKEYTKVVILSILHANNRILDNYVRSIDMAADGVRPTPKCIWQWYLETGNSCLTMLNPESYMALMPRAKGKITRYGLSFNYLYYRNEEYDARCAIAGIKGAEPVTVAYDTLDTGRVWLYEDEKYIEFELTDSQTAFMQLSYTEARAFADREKEMRKSLRRSNDQLSVSINNAIESIGAQAEAMQPMLLSPSSILKGDEENDS